MSRRFTLYWSSMKMYEECPQKFLWSRGWPGIDVGGGPGKRKPVPERKSDHHRIMGIVIQWVIERFYNDELWKHPKGLRKRLESLVEEKFESEVSRSKWYLPWGQPDKFGEVPTRGEALEICRDGVLGYLATMKQHKLLGPRNKAEIDLLGYINKWNPIGGRADVLNVREDETGITITDGKNASSKDKYVDPDQLRWYALCFYLAFNGKMVDRLGFVWYRYPYDEETGEDGVMWVSYTKDDLKGLARRAVDARKGMEAGQFDPTPAPKVCKLCDYEDVCPARQRQREENSKKRKRKPKAVEVEVSGQEGFVDLKW